MLGQVVEHECAVMGVNFCQPQGGIKIFVGTHYTGGDLFVFKLAEVSKNHSHAVQYQAQVFTPSIGWVSPSIHGVSILHR